MKKIQENKKIWIIAGVILLVFIVILLATQCGKKNDERDTNSDKFGQETIIDNDDSDGVNNSETNQGLEVADPEEADKAETENKVEFVGPDGSSTNTDSDSIDNNNITSNGGSEGNSNDTDDGDNTDNNKETDNSEDTGNLDEEPDNNGQYGGFF